MTYYYLDGIEKKGPYTLDEIHSRNLSSDTMVFCEGMQNWSRLSNLDDLNVAIEIDNIKIKSEKIEDFKSEKFNKRNDFKFNKNYIYFLLIPIILIVSGYYFYDQFILKNYNKKEKFEEQLKRDLENNAFKSNCSFNVVELKVNEIKFVRIDSVFREISFDRLNEINKYLSSINAKANDYGKTFDNDSKLKEIDFEYKKKNRNLNLKGSFVKYSVKGTYISNNKYETNILFDTVLAHFDENDILLYNHLHFTPNN